MGGSHNFFLSLSQPLPWSTPTVHSNLISNKKEKKRETQKNKNTHPPVETINQFSFLRLKGLVMARRGGENAQRDKYYLLLDLVAELKIS